MELDVEEAVARVVRRANARYNEAIERLGGKPHLTQWEINDFLKQLAAFADFIADSWARIADSLASFAREVEAFARAVAIPIEGVKKDAHRS